MEKMAAAFKVHRSGYYRWKKNRNSKKINHEEKLVNEIKEIQESVKYSYGSPRVTDELKKRGNRINHKRVANLMRKNNLNYKKKKKFKITTDSAHNLEVAPNLLNREFKVSAPNKVWVSDITYIWTQEGWLYLCVILDLFNRKVVGWAISNRINTELPLRAFWMAKKTRNPGKGLMFHSDRGSQYCSKRLKNTLKSFGYVQSMSRKGNCWDNACAESFFKSLKSEWLYDECFKTRQEAKNVLFEYIEIFYNRKRIHSALNYFTPEQVELKFVA
jgi:transposase InsO family protein